MRVPIAVAIVSLMLAAFAVTGASAAPNPNPSGHGQPGADCESEAMAPMGFSSGGFLHAKTVYANPGVVPSTASPNAVSQYDVACYQVTTNHSG
jgi:hypothetical protein